MKERGGHEDVNEDVGNDRGVRGRRRRGRPPVRDKCIANVVGLGGKPGGSHFGEADALGLVNA